MDLFAVAAKSTASVPPLEVDTAMPREKKREKPRTATLVAGLGIATADKQRLEAMNPALRAREEKRMLHIRLSLSPPILVFRFAAFASWTSIAASLTNKKE